jgi:hypothetical protein
MRQTESLRYVGGLARQVVNQTERIFDVTSRKIRLILDDLATTPRQPVLGFFDIIDSNFQHRPERRTALDE